MSTLPSATVGAAGPVGSAVYEHEAFVIYADEDADWCIREFITPLERAGVRVIHKQAFKYGKPLFRTEDEAIRSSLCTIAFLTRAWVKSKQATFLADRAWALERLIPVFAEECEPDERVRGLTGADLTDPTRWREGFRRLLEQLGRSAQEAQEAAAQTVVRGLKALAKLMQHPPILEAVAQYLVSFPGAASTIELIGHFKALHDDFQEADDSFRLVIERRRGAAATAPLTPAPLGEELEEAVDDLRAEVRQLRMTAKQTRLPAHEVPWVAQLGPVIDRLTSALTAADGALLTEPLERFQRMLGLHPPRINARIVDAVAQLSLVQVADDLQAARETLAQYSFDEVAHALFDEFGTSVASLRTLARNLEALHANHNWLQTIDDALRPLNGNRRPTPAEIEAQWQDVVGPVSQLDAAAGPSWVNDFQACAGDVDQALRAANSPAGVRALQRAFNTFRTELNKAFNRADRDLLTLCGQLQTVGQALHQTIERMQHA